MKRTVWCARVSGRVAECSLVRVAGAWHRLGGPHAAYAFEWHGTRYRGTSMAAAWLQLGAGTIHLLPDLVSVVSVAIDWSVPEWLCVGPLMCLGCRLWALGTELAKRLMQWYCHEMGPWSCCQQAGPSRSARHIYSCTPHAPQA